MVYREIPSFCEVKINIAHEHSIKYKQMMIKYRTSPNAGPRLRIKLSVFNTNRIKNLRSKKIKTTLRI